MDGKHTPGPWPAPEHDSDDSSPGTRRAEVAVHIDWSKPIETNERAPRPVRVLGEQEGGAIDYVSVFVEDGESRYHHPPGEYCAAKVGGLIRGNLAVRNVDARIVALRAEVERLKEANATTIDGHTKAKLVRASADVERLGAMLQEAHDKWEQALQGYEALRAEKAELFEVLQDAISESCSNCRGDCGPVFTCWRQRARAILTKAPAT